MIGHFLGKIDFTPAAPMSGRGTYFLSYSFLDDIFPIFRELVRLFFQQAAGVVCRKICKSSGYSLTL